MYLIAGLNPEETKNTTKSDHSRRLLCTHLSWTRLVTWNQTTCHTLSSLVHAWNLKGQFAQNSSSSMTRYRQMERRCLIWSTVMELHALRAASVTPSQPLDDSPDQFAPTQHHVYVALQSHLQSGTWSRVPIGCFWLLFYSKVMDLWATAAAREKKASGSTRTREESDFE